MPQNLQFKPVPDKDLAQITELWVSSWKTLGWDIDFDERRSWFPGYLQSLMREGALLIGAYHQSCLGFFTLNLKTCYLDQICVDPASIGKGVAKALLDEAKRLSPQQILLTVNAANERAIRFYQREHFYVTGEGISTRSGLKTLHMRWQP